MKQRSPEWFQARLGIPTASNFGKIITASGIPSDSAQGYLCRLIGERVLGRSLEEPIHSKWVDHGILWEDKAAMAFEELTGKRTEFVGFVPSGNKLWGCSPDRLIAGENEALEIKCPSPWKHIEYLMYGPGRDYKQQVQGQMLVGGYDRVHFFSYFPGMVPCHRPFTRDESFILKLRSALTEFSKQLEKNTEEFKKIGPTDLETAIHVIRALMPEE